MLTPTLRPVTVALTVLILLLAGSASSAAERAVPEKVSRLAEGGREALAEGNYKRALRRFEKAGRNYREAVEKRAEGLPPELPAELLAGLAQAHLELEHHQEVIDHADRLLAVAEGSAQRAKGQNLLGLGFFGRAAETERRAARLGVEASRTDEEEAERIRQESEELDAAATQEYLTAADAFRRVIELTGGRSGAAWQSFAQALYLGGEHDRARKAIDRFAEALGPKRKLPETAAALDECLAALEGQPTVLAPTAPDLEPPKKISAPPPQVPDRARGRHARGKVVIQATIDTEGRVVCPRVLEGGPLGFTDAALEAVLGWRFEPATREGEPVPVHYTLTTMFRLQ